MTLSWSLVERLSRQQVQQIQEARLSTLLRYLNQTSDYYRNLFNLLGIQPDRFRLKDLCHLPFTTKEDLANDVAPGEAAGLYATYWVGDPRQILRWHRTSGTTGSPIRVADTMWDWNFYAELSAEALYALGVRASDVAVAAFGYGPFIGLWGYIAGIERIGAAFVPCGGMDTHSRLHLMREFRTTVLMTTSSYAAHMGEVARNVMNMDVAREMGLRLIVVTGEPCPPALKQKIVSTWGVPVYDRLGCAEVGGIAYECPANPGTYHVQEGYMVAEVLDPVTMVPVNPGQEGELVVTPLYRRGMPLLRFRTRNIVRLAGAERCRCARELLSLSETEHGVVVRRTDTLTKVRGVLVDPQLVEQRVRCYPELTEAVQIVIERVGERDEVTVRAEARQPLSRHSEDDLVARLQADLRAAMGLRVRVCILPLGALQPQGDKVKRVLDLRGASLEDGSGAADT